MMGLRTLHGTSFTMMTQPIRHRRPKALDGLPHDPRGESERFEVEAWLGRPLRATHDRPPGGITGLGPRAVPDKLPELLAEDARRGRHEGLIGSALAACFLGALFMGWAIPLLTAAFCAAPVIAAIMEWQDHRRAAAA